MRCLMPGVRPRIQPVSASVSSASSLDEVSQLELHLQRQFEEDIARIFDESIYSDLEVVCGKLKILTHSCILKARTHKFYHKLEAILHVNIGRNTFDEIYSFVSDAYTECDIQHQENEIIHYLNEKLNLKPAIAEKKNKQEDLDESDAYATPNCVSPEDSLQKTLSSSPSTELTKEYYALVPIEGQVLDKELIEQDELSSGFKSFIHVHTDHLNDSQITHCIKPTTLSLNSSHITNINNHSIICEIAKDLKDIDSNSFLFENDPNKIKNATSQVRKYIKSTQLALKKSNSCEISGVAGEAGYSPDSLIADEGSSSSDYLSAAHSVSPGGPHVSTLSNLPDNIYKMNNTITTVSDSGFDNNGMLESLNSHKDVTLADVSLTESTFHDLLTDDVTVANDSSQLPKPKSSNSQVSHKNALKTSTADMSGRSKYEKQRQNEEILILESSSLSSETGSWESVFPPKMPEKDLCEKFINTERHNSIEPVMNSEAAMNTTVIEISDTDYKSESSSCFINAASLIDDEETPDAEQIVHSVLRLSSEPVPCESKQTISSSEYSESNDNDDSLEQPDPDSIQKVISPTIFEMTIASEDSIQGDNSYEGFKAAISSNGINNCAQSSKVQNMANVSTPNNSIISVKANNLKTLNSERCDNGAAILKPKNSTVEQLKTQNVKVLPLCETKRLHTIRQDILFEDFNRMHQSPPNQSEESLKENSLPQDAFNHTDPSNNVTKPGLQWHVETTIVDASVYSISSEEYSPTPKALCNPTWVVDMAKRDNATTNKNNKKPGDNSLKGSSKYSSSSEGCKSRGSVDSDSSERSTHKFYIDLSTLPDTLPPDESGTSKASFEKKNIFSMFIDLGEKSSIKEMPPRLSSSLNIKKNKSETKHSSAKAIKQHNRSINGDEAFEKLESLCDSTEMSISEILQNTIVNKIDKQKILVEKVETQDHHRSFTREIIAPTIQEEPDTELGDVFVKLSDLDRAPAEKNDIISIAPNAECSERMSRSIPGNNWGRSCNTSSRSIDIISSFHSENALSLNRLFPHLKNDFSRSMPGSLSGRTWPPLKVGASSSSDRDEPASEMSEMSSVQSSMCRSIVENSTTEDTGHNSSLIVNCQSRLGQDLLRMFIEEIAPDVVVEVGGRRIKAHKCILSSRCQYFAAILSGGWVESAGNVISLPPFSYTVVHFVLCHIYSGISTIPDTVSIVELATIADMLCLEGLKEAIMFTLKARYCHHFHEPCQVCTAGVLECLSLTSVYGLDDLYRRCLRWITRHFRKVWPTKAFATLPSELLEKCYQEQILNLSTHNLIDTVHDCGRTVASLQRSRWADVVARLCRKLAGAAAELAAAQLTEVIRVVLGAGAVRAAAHACATRALDACLATAVDNASADELCRAHALLQEVGDTPDTIALRRRCEAALLKCAPSALTAPAFRDLPVEVRRRLRRQVDSTAPSAPDLTSFVTYARRPAPTAPAPRGNATPRVRTTKAQEERAKYNLNKKTVAKTRDKAPAKPRDKATEGCTSYVNTKPRYLKRRPAKEPVGEAVRKPLGRLVSSSESSCNSSPVVARAPVPCPAPTLRPRTADPSTESLSDSLNANKYATYTKTRRNDTKAPPMQLPKTISNSTHNKRTKATKIPVYRGAAATMATVMTAPTTVMSSSGGERSSPLLQPRHRGSLMMATKSSSAKIVPKIQKEAPQPHSKNLKEGTKAGGKTRPRSPNISDIPLMERSGTFLKDEPTFGDKTTNIDIGE